jgi:hypothetical protein
VAMMGGLTIFVLIALILVAVMFSVIGSEITLKLATLFWIILATLVASAIWTIFLLASFIGDGNKKFKD